MAEVKASSVFGVIGFITGYKVFYFYQPVSYDQYGVITLTLWEIRDKVYRYILL